MALVSITVDVYCNRSEGEPSYRIYVDDEMLTERSWVWPAYEVFVKEHVEVNVESGAHRIEVRGCNCDAIFTAKDMTVNGSLIQGTNGVFFA